jgi:hypothetical protein
MVLGPLALSAFGYLIVWLAGRNTKRQQRLIDDSEPVDAVIIDSVVGTTTPGNDGVFHQQAKSAHVTFEYEYEGDTYQSTHLRPGGTQFGSASGTTAKQRAGKYETGDSVTAHVPKSDPRLAFLEAQTSGKSHLVMRLIGWGITGLGLLLALVLLLV